MRRIEKIRDRVNHYKPLIEQDTGVPLGEIPVRKVGVFSAEYIKNLHPRQLLTSNFLAFGMNPKSIAVYPNSVIHYLMLEEDATDIYVVHELSHALWNEIEPIDKHNKDDAAVRRLHRVWMEGFAVYCSETHFWRLYPKEVRYHLHTTPYPEYYSQGLWRVNMVTAREGNEVLLEIPSRWQEFERNIIRQ